MIEISEGQFIGSIISATLVIGGALITSHISMIRSNAELKERVKVLEVMMDKFGMKAARALHHTFDPYGLDLLLDKYLDCNYELSNEEWQELRARCIEVENRPDASKEDKFFAGMLEAVCMHKLFIPPPMRKDSNQKYQITNEN